MILLSSSVVLGLVVLVGVPVLVLTLGAVIKPLQARQRAQREEVGRLTALGADTAAGLRVLRGIGGEQAFFDRYRDRSQRVRRAGVDVATPQSTLDAAQVLLPGIFVVLVTWLGARFVLSGRIDAGDLVAFYGYAAFLVIPLRTAAEAVDKITRALVGARRMLDVLAVQRVVTEPDALPGAAAGRPLVDERSGSRRARPLTCIVSAVPDESSAIAARLGRLDADGACGSATARSGAPARRLRRRIVVSEQDPSSSRASSAPSSIPGGRGSDDAVLAALAVANAQDVLDALPGGLDAEVDERGRSFSGGQRQRLVLARRCSRTRRSSCSSSRRARSTPTPRRASRATSTTARDGRTTVIVTTSPLVLDRADRVVLVEEGLAAAVGTHRELLRATACYREVVTRGESE